MTNDNPQPAHQFSRRALLQQSLSFGALLAWPILGWSEQSPAGTTPSRTGSSLPSESQLAESEFVYVSPLLSNGRESTCHGEVWYAWLDDSIVLITAKTTWKARALSRGMNSARIWVGDHGRWKGWFRNNEAFRQAPSSDAVASIDNDASLLDQLMKVYETKYPEEFSEWEDRQRSGFRSGVRIIIRYSKR